MILFNVYHQSSISRQVCLWSKFAVCFDDFAKKTHFVAKPNDQIQEIALVVYDPIVMFIFELVKRQIELQEIHTKVTQ